jgi:hypothetical protein
MDDNVIKKYLAEEYAKATEFYDKRASAAKCWYRVLSICLIVVSAGLTPVVALAPDEPCWRIVSTLLSATIVVFTGLLAHLKSHENWLSYRGSWDALERERRQFQTSTGAYAGATDKGSLFVDRVEAILAREGADFYARHAKGEDQAKRPEKT